ncbi:hypothetical protein CASFOL_023235 [Castilleja foliolosa]|uniref:RNase H type-1 domain-containing protein n=1 Tax=Castilleja foliolosa TaxID=1961234 RepID=A0ABD3CMU7_9LAMI
MGETRIWTGYTAINISLEVHDNIFKAGAIIRNHKGELEAAIWGNLNANSEEIIIQTLEKLGHRNYKIETVILIRDLNNQSTNLLPAWLLDAQISTIQNQPATKLAKSAGRCDAEAWNKDGRATNFSAPNWDL